MADETAREYELLILLSRLQQTNIDMMPVDEASRTLDKLLDLAKISDGETMSLATRYAGELWKRSKEK